MAGCVKAVGHPRGARAEARPRARLRRRLRDGGATGAAVRIGLLTPYGGGNLGDAAIQEAVIDNLRRRIPGVEFVGINLAPARTAAIHGIAAFGLSGRFGGYAAAASQRPAFGDTAAAADAAVWKRDEAANGWRSRVKSLPGIGAPLQRLVRAGRSLWLARHEPLHLWRSLRLAAGLDAILVTGGGQLDEYWGGPWQQPYALYRWSALARAAGIPFIVMSVGAGRLETRTARWLVRGALRRARYRSYRDPGTAERVAGWSFTRHDARVPDLAFSLRSAAAAAEPGGASERLDVGLGVISFGHPELWRLDEDEGMHARYLDALVALAEQLLNAGHTLTWFATGAQDRPVMEQAQARLQAAMPELPAGRLNVLRGHSVAGLLAALESMDVVVASRLHSVILAHLCGVPTVAVSFDRKVDAHMDMAGEGDVCLDIRRIDARTLEAAFRRICATRAGRRRSIAAHVRTWRDALDAQYGAVVDMIRKPGPEAAAVPLAQRESR